MRYQYPKVRRDDSAIDDYNGIKVNPYFGETPWLTSGADTGLNLTGAITENGHQAP